MSLLHTLTKESHKDPLKFRVNYDDAVRILGKDSKLPENDNLPVETGSSRVVIIGAGVAGMAAAIRLKKELKEEDYWCFDKSTDLGGTWWNNTYLNAASDSPAAHYSFSTDRVSNWSRPQPLQYEYMEYLDGVAEKWALRDKIRFNSIVKACHWSEAEQKWTVEARDTKTGQRIQWKCEIILNCIGALAQPNHYQVEGLDTFEGEFMQSALWRHDVDMKGKRVVLIGNGCTANQAFPGVLAKDPSQLTQIVRSQHYIMPPIPHSFQQAYLLFSQWLFGSWLFRMIVAFGLELRWPLFRGNGFFSRLVRRYLTNVSLSYMKRECPEKFQDALIPKFKIGCKRMIFDHDYLKSLHDPRVHVTNLLIKRIDGKTLHLEDGSTIECDVLIACTGYDVAKSMMLVDFFGKDGLLLRKTWNEEGISAYQTLLVKEIPNMWILAGPNSITGHALVIMAIENGLNFFEKTVKPILDGKATLVTVSDEAYDKWLKTTQEELQECVFGTPFGGCVSWYATSKTIFTTYPRSQIDYWYRCLHPKFKDLEYTKPKSH